MKDFDIRLQKNECIAGETVRGDLVLSIKKNGFKARKFKFYVFGEEKTKIIVDIGIPKTYQESNVFFYKDLSHFPSSVEKVVWPDSTMEVPQGDWLIPFEFIIPKYAYESYNGRNVSIIYEIRLMAEREWKEDINEKVSFTVINPNVLLPETDMMVHLSEVRIRRKEGGYLIVKLDLEGGSNFHSGETIKGRISLEGGGEYLQEKTDKAKEVRDAEIVLQSIEYSRTKETEKTITVNTYKQKVEMNIEENSSDALFEFQIPQTVKRSYKGMYSTYYWVLGIRFDIAQVHNVDLRTTIQII